MTLNYKDIDLLKGLYCKSRNIISPQSYYNGKYSPHISRISNVIRVADYIMSEGRSKPLYKLITIRELLLKWKLLQKSLLYHASLQYSEL